MNGIKAELERYPFCLFDDKFTKMSRLFSHDEISHLDLQSSSKFYPNRRIAEEDTFFTRGTIRPGTRIDLSPQRALRKSGCCFEKIIFCPEESFRNDLRRETRPLLTLNLDLPAGREFRFKLELDAINLPLKGEICLFTLEHKKFVWEQKLVSLAELALEQTDNKLKLLKWMVDFRPLESHLIPRRLQLSMAKILSNEGVDSELLVKCFGKFIGISALLQKFDSKALEYLLHNARLSDFDVRSKISCVSSLSDYGINALHFYSVPSFLTYEDTVYFTEEAYEVYKKKSSYRVRRDHMEEEMSRSESQMSKQRLYRILQIIYIFHYGRHRRVNCPCFEALRLLWRSIPDSYVSLQEMNDAYEPVFSAYYISLAHSYYEEAIEQTVSNQEPRRLSQHCRTRIRKSLHDSKQWLPEGINQLPLPPRFKHFLKLESDNLRPEK